MNDINPEHIDFLEFILKSISKEYPLGHSISRLSYLYEKETGIKTENDIFIRDLYKDKYFTLRNNYLISIPEIKRGIERYGSLSEFLAQRDQKNKKAKKSKNWPVIATIILMSLSLIWNVISETKKSTLNNKVDKLETEIIIKDSIIFELKNELIKLDTIK
jgi:hypothetical protein